MARRLLPSPQQAYRLPLQASGTMTDEPLEETGPRPARRSSRTKPGRAPADRRPTHQVVEWLWDRYLAEHRLSVPRRRKAR